MVDLAHSSRGLRAGTGLVPMRDPLAVSCADGIIMGVEREGQISKAN